MADPAPSAGGGLTGGLLKKLSPKGRRYAAAVAIAMVLALIVVLGKRNKAQPPVDQITDPNAAVTDGSGDLSQPVPLGDPPFQPQSTFADNGEAAGVLGSAITEGLSQVGSALTDEQTSLKNLTDQIAAGSPTGAAPATAPGPLGKTGAGKNKAQAAKLQKAKDVAAARKRRIGQLQKQGKPKKGAAKKPAGKKKKKK